MSLDIKWDDKIFWTEWLQAFSKHTVVKRNKKQELWSDPNKAEPQYTKKNLTHCHFVHH
jgi:hypothetical protein